MSSSLSISCPLALPWRDPRPVIAIRKLQARFMSGDVETALDASRSAHALLWTLSHSEAVEYHFCSALCHVAVCRSATPDDRQQHLEAITAHQEQLKVWANNCPENFENRVALVDAEIAGLEGRELDAERLYEQAIRSARDNAFVQNEALAYELAARFYAARGFEQIAHRLSAQRPPRVSSLGSRRQGAATRAASSAPPGERASSRPDDHDRGAGSASRPRDRHQGVAGRVGRNRPGKADRYAGAHRRSSRPEPSEVCCFFCKAKRCGSQPKLRPAVIR